MVSANGGSLSDIPKLNISTKWKKILSSVNPNQFQFKKKPYPCKTRNRLRSGKS